MGRSVAGAVGSPRVSADFYDLKADVEALLAASGESMSYRSSSNARCLHPGRSARILKGDRPCGWIGDLHPELARADRSRRRRYYSSSELDITSAARVPAATEITRLPVVRRDLAIVVDETLTFSQLRESVTVAASSLLQELKVFDVYRAGG